MANNQCRGQRGSVPIGLLFLIILLPSKVQHVNCQLKISFYAKTCPRAESIVKDAVSFAILNDQTLAGSLIRMHFHDCFTTGSDGSILLDSVNGQQAEKDAQPNKNIRGYEVIDSAKSKVDAICPGVVSCADILTYAARDSVVLVGSSTSIIPSPENST